MRSKFGKPGLERLLSDFLPAHMYEFQASPGDGGGRPDAIIYFPDRSMQSSPVSRFLRYLRAMMKPRSRKLGFTFVRVMKEQAKRVKAYIQAENGTTDIALMKSAQRNALHGSGT
jgi:DNA anti-recombination protein RmuC